MMTLKIITQTFNENTCILIHNRTDYLKRLIIVVPNSFKNAFDLEGDSKHKMLGYNKNKKYAELN